MRTSGRMCGGREAHIALNNATAEMMKMNSKITTLEKDIKVVKQQLNILMEYHVRHAVLRMPSAN
eukprot:1420769-Pyramimonas_sp.AAC.2